MVKKQQGFAVAELILVLAIVAIVAVIGLKVAGHRTATQTSATTPTASSSQAPIKTTVTTAPPVTSSSDLDNASKVLDQNDPSTANVSDSGALDSDSSGL